MKKMFFSLFGLCTMVASQAQSSKYEAAMKKNLLQMDTLSTYADAQNLAAAFERIGNAEKTQWLPFYYAGLCFVKPGFKDAKADKDSIGAQIDFYADKANAISENAENYALKYVADLMHLIVDPMSRYQTYGPLAEKMYQKGIALDSLNPRLYYLKGSTVLNTPAFVGGGPKVAKPILEKAAVLFSKEDTTTLLPHWGKSQNAMMLEKTN